MKMADTTIHKDINVPPTLSFSKFRKEVAEVFYKDLPDKKKTASLMTGKDFILTVIGSGKIIDRGNTHIKKAMTDGCQVEVKLRGVGGARSIKPTKKDAKLEKSMGYKKALDEASASVNRQVLTPLDFVGVVEKNLHTFANSIQNNAEDAILKAMMPLSIAELDEMTRDVSQKGGSVEGKIVKYAGRLLGLHQVIEAHRSLDCVIQSAESLLMMAVNKTAGEGSDLVAFKKLIERARYVKMGQESMTRAGASQEGDAHMT
eukprot:Skav200821  [mRNA]  locus=scaffold4339:2106:2885:- [translate_table: standard]